VYTPSAQSSNSLAYTPPSQFSSLQTSSTPIYTPPVQSSDTPTPTPTITGNECPGADTKTINTPKGAFVVECYYDRYDNDMGAVSANNFDQCVQICANTDGCVDVSYVPNGPCYLKSGQQPGSTNNNIWGARWVGYSSSTPSVTTATPTTASQSTPTSGKVFQIQCGVDHSVSNVRSPF
jgi:hypothetical protein